MKNAVQFFLNGVSVTIENPSPDLLLIDYLRSPEVALAGPKKPCGQGGCGGCTVIVSEWNPESDAPDHIAINSCLRPVCAIGGLSITTVEGTGATRKPDPQSLTHRPSSTRSSAPIGDYYSPILNAAIEKTAQKRASVLQAIQDKKDAGAPENWLKIKEDIAEHPTENSHEGMNPVAHRLAANNGSQCGYCSVGFVMNMSEFIVNNPNATKKEIESAFDGNLCRCTGYRPILTGMKTFASDWSAEDEENRMKCMEDSVAESQLPGYVSIPFPPEAHKPTFGVNSARWTSPSSMAELATALSQNKNPRMVHGNTSFGVYTAEFTESTHYIDIRFIPELNTEVKFNRDELYFPASITYRHLLETLAAGIDELGKVNRKDAMSDKSVLEALNYMAHRTAGRIVRNAATVGGNTMMVLKHIARHTGDIFPSDLFTALSAANAHINYYELKAGNFVPLNKTVDELIQLVVNDASLADRIVLAGYTVPLKKLDTILFSQKVALREVNSHTIVNATTNYVVNDSLTVKSADIVFGGITPYPWHARKTEKAMTDSKLGLADISRLTAILSAEVMAELIVQEPRMEEMPAEGFTNEYRVQLAVSFFYKSIINALIHKGEAVPENLQSSGEVQWGNWPVSDGKQTYAHQGYKAPVGMPYIKSTAMYQASGQIHYMHELPVPPRALNGAFVQSTKALMNFCFIHPDTGETVLVEELRPILKARFPEFTDIITKSDIKNEFGNYQGMGSDQPLFADELISYVGQSIAMILSQSEQESIRIAAFVSEHCIGYTQPGAPWVGPWEKPIIDLLDAIKLGSVFPDTPKSAPFVSHIWKITRPGSQFDWTQPLSLAGQGNSKPLVRELPIKTRVTDVDNIPCVVVTASQLCGGQAHFYMEPQGCIATPLDQGRVKVQPSVQSPGGMHDTVALALGYQHNQVEIEVPMVGGGFGGKTEQTRFVAGPTAVAAQATKQPVRLAVPRDVDTALIGKRHGYYGEYEIAVDNGDVKPDQKGVIHGLKLNLWGDGGAFYDCSFIVSNCVQLRTDNAYNIANFQSQLDVCRTNTAPNTAMRAFGDVQGKNILENALDDAAVALSMRPEDLREKNLYDRGDVTPFGQALSYCYMKQVWEYAKQVSSFEAKYVEVEKFNRENKWRKRGISMIPVKYGSGYNLLLLEQAAAVVVVNPKDGSVIIHQGGVEIGQGLATQSLQVASYVLGIPMDLIFIDQVKTSIVPNPTSTGGSTGTPYSAEAVKQTCMQMRSRMMEFGYQMLTENGDEWCKEQKIDFWNYGAGEGKGWATKVKGPNGETMIWQNLINVASANRVDMIASFNAKINGGEVPVPAMTFKTQDEQPNIPGIERDTKAPIGGGVDSFVGFTYSVACSVSEVDILTGEVKIISSDIVYDMGWSMNPALDIGQVEGAFVQGIGYLLTEKLVSETEGEHVGRLNTTNTWRYKIPAITEIPLEMNTFLFPRNLASVESIPEDPNEIFSAKEVGEPPLVLANSVFFAIKAAIRASRVERGLPDLFLFDAPATVQEVRRACAVKDSDFNN